MEKAPNHEGLAIGTVHGETGKWLAKGNTERKRGPSPKRAERKEWISISLRPA